MTETPLVKSRPTMELILPANGDKHDWRVKSMKVKQPQFEKIRITTQQTIAIFASNLLRRGPNGDVFDLIVHKEGHEPVTRELPVSHASLILAEVKLKDQEDDDYRNTRYTVEKKIGRVWIPENSNEVRDFITNFHNNEKVIINNPSKIIGKYYILYYNFFWDLVSIHNLGVDINLSHQRKILFSIPLIGYSIKIVTHNGIYGPDSNMISK
jgi:hypothetical protein